MSDLEKNQDNQGWGGPRPGSGRPKGSSKKPKIIDYMTQEEIDEMVQLYISQCREKPDLMKHLMDQIFGKPKQNVSLDGGEDEEGTPKPVLVKFIDGSNTYNLNTDRVPKTV